MVMVTELRFQIEAFQATNCWSAELNFGSIMLDARMLAMKAYRYGTEN
jgi:hypothetical protein